MTYWKHRVGHRPLNRDDACGPIALWHRWSPCRLGRSEVARGPGPDPADHPEELLAERFGHREIDAEAFLCSHEVLDHPGR